MNKEFQDYLFEEESADRREISKVEQENNVNNNTPENMIKELRRFERELEDTKNKIKEIHGRGTWGKLRADNVRDLADCMAGQNKLIGQIANQSQRIIALALEGPEEARKVQESLNKVLKNNTDNIGNTFKVLEATVARHLSLEKRISELERENSQIKLDYEIVKNNVSRNIKLQSIFILFSIVFMSYLFILFNK